MSGFSDLISGIGGLVSGIGEVIAGSPNAVSTAFGSFSPELELDLLEGIQTFYYDYNAIISWLETYSPNATIIANTIYNPIPQEVLGASISLSSWADFLIESMNSVILEKSNTHGFLVTDIAHYFSHQTDYLRFNLRPADGNISFDIVHPNANGHNRIAQLNYATFKHHAGILDSP